MSAVLDPRRALTPKWTKDQLQLMKTSVAKGTTDDEFKLFLYTCKRTGLDPFVKQIYAIKRFDADSNSYIMGVQVGIDGYRLIASRTGELAGIDEAKFEIDPNESWHPATATVTVYRMNNGERIPYTHTCRWTEYVQKKKDGSPTRMWSQQGMPFNQLGKCAEAGALKKAFPNDLSGLTTVDEAPIIDITGADGVSEVSQEEKKADTKSGDLYVGQLTAVQEKNPQKKTPHRYTFRLDAGGEITVSAFEGPACLKDGAKLVGARFQFAYEEKPNPRDPSSPFRNLTHAAREVAQTDADTKDEAPAAEKKAEEKPAEAPTEAQQKAFTDFAVQLDACAELDELRQLYTGTIQKKWQGCTQAQRQELSGLYAGKRKALGGE